MELLEIAALIIIVGADIGVGSLLWLAFMRSAKWKKIKRVLDVGDDWSHLVVFCQCYLFSVLFFGLFWPLILILDRLFHMKLFESETGKNLLETKISNL